MVNQQQGKNANRRGGERGRGNRQNQPADEFEQVTIEIARVTRVMAGGKRMRFRACVVIGNKRGKVGAAIAKGADVTLAVGKAATKARKYITTVPLIRETIPHRVDCKYGAAQVMLKPAPKGTGVMAGGAVRSVLEMAGVSNVVAKILGSKNKLNNVRATIKALQALKAVAPKTPSTSKQAD